MMKKYPHYRKTLKDGAKKAVDNLEEMFQKQWDNNQKDMMRVVEKIADIAENYYVFDDEILNDGEKGGNDNGEDEIYND